MAPTLKLVVAGPPPSRLPVSPATTAFVGRVLMGILFFGFGVDMERHSHALIERLPLRELGFIALLTIDLVGAVALGLGCHTRRVAAILVIDRLLAAASVHAPWTDPHQLGRALEDLAVVGGLLQVVAFGGGRWALDAPHRDAKFRRASLSQPPER